MTTIKNLVSLLAAIPTPTPSVISAPSLDAVARPCGEVNVFYTGLPPYHPMTAGQGWSCERVDIGLKNQTAALVKAGYNVHVVWAGPETPMSTLEDRFDHYGVDWDVTAIGFGVRSTVIVPLVERFEELVEMYNRKAPDARKTFNHNPESLVWSVTHRFPTTEDCAAAGKPGKLYAYEEICDSRCDRLKFGLRQMSGHDEL